MSIEFNRKPEIKIVRYAMLGSILNMVYEVADDLEDEELSLAIEGLQKMVDEKIEMVLNTNIEWTRK